MYNEKRTGFDRRSLTDGRRLFGYGSPIYHWPERRRHKDRRSQTEKRTGWVRVSNWSSKSSRDFEKMLEAYS
jgi:hypothetical protein